MRRLFILTRSMVRMFLRDRYMLFWNTVFPVFLLFIFGTVFGAMRVDGQPYMAWALPGMVVLNLMAFGLIRSSATMVEMRQQGVLRQLRATPVPALHLVGSYIVVDVLLCLAQSAMLVFVSDLFMPRQSLPDWLQHVAAYLPAYAVVQVVRPPLLAQALRADVSWYLLLVVLYGVAATLLTARLFRWQPQQ